ncbi:MAG: hypothetical protein P9M00_07865 [Candidatus Tritonobacter lacicola]|nr:hypothetical protein [Candidatus Tritonobacter lacicola]
MLCISGSGLGQYFITTRQHLTLALWLFVPSVAGCALLLGISGVPGLVEGCAPSWKIVRGRGSLARLTAFILSAAGIALLVYTSRLMFYRWGEYYFISIGLYGAGLAFLAVGLNHVGRSVVKARLPWRAGRKLEITLLVLVLAVGVFMRSYRLDYYPPPDGVSCVEEPQQGHRAFKMLYGKSHPWEYYESNLVTLLTFKTLGMSLLTLRVNAVVMACLTLVPFYLLVRLMMGWKVSLAVTFLFSVSRWHLCYARISHNVFLPVFFVILCIYLLVRTRYSWKPSNYVWVGLLAAVLLFSYAGYRATIIIAGYYLVEKIVRGAWGWRKRPGRGGDVVCASLGRTALGLLIALGVALAIALPMFNQVQSARYYFEAASRTTQPYGGYYAEKDFHQYLKLRWRRIVATAGLLTYRGDDARTMNLPSEPMMDPLSGLLFFLGFAYCIVTMGKDEHLFFAVVLLAGVFLGAIFVHNFDPRRLIGIIPLLYIFVAFSLSALWTYVSSRGSRPARGVFIALVVAVCLFSFWYNYTTFFCAQISDKSVRASWKNHYTILIEHIKDLHEDSYVVVMSPIIHNLFIPNDYEWMYKAQGKCVRTFDEIFPLPEQENVIVIFQAPHNVEALAKRFGKMHPGASCRYHTDPDRNDLRIAVCTLDNRVSAPGEKDPGVKEK